MLMDTKPVTPPKKLYTWQAAGGEDRAVKGRKCRCGLTESLYMVLAGKGERYQRELTGESEGKKWVIFRAVE